MAHDLTTHATWICPSNINWSIKVQGSRGAEHTVRYGRLFGRDLQVQGCDYGYTCTCAAFTKSRKSHLPCKHIKAVLASDERCAWNWEMEPGAEAARDADGKFICPDCGERVTAINVAV